MTFPYTGPDDEDKCADEGCGHPRYMHRKGAARCMEGKGERRWRCDCQRFEGDPPVAATIRRVPNAPGTPRRTIRISDELWSKAVAKAEERGEDVSAVIRKALERYVSRR